MGLREVRRGLRFVDVYGLRGAASLHAGVLLQKPLQRPKARGVHLLSASVRLRRDDHMRLWRVHKEKVAAMHEWDPILLRRTGLAVGEAVGNGLLRRVVHIDAGRDVHLGHRIEHARLVDPARHVSGTRRVGVKGDGHAPVQRHGLRVLRPRHHMADERAVLRHIGLLDAQVDPLSVENCTQANPLAQVQGEGLDARRRPSSPSARVDVEAPEEDLRMPDLVLDSDLAVVEGPNVALGLEAMAARCHHDLAVAYEHGWVDDDRVRYCAGITEFDAHVDALVPGADDGGDLRERGRDRRRVRQKAEAAEQTSHDERHGQSAPSVRSPPALNRLLHADRHHHGEGGHEDKEEGQVDPPGLRPKAVANELEDIDAVRIFLEEVELREGKGEGRLRQARQAGESQEHHRLKGQQHGEPRGDLVAPSARIEARDIEDE
mmetsp:Transcript_103344/g.297591  ORF Transcript_103344/g.297591 Transcript_103344/m.297591 type:complete len:433 (-) Transcript_103344:1565-2863(-)